MSQSEHPSRIEQSTIHFGTCSCGVAGQLFRSGRCAHCHIAVLERLVDDRIGRVYELTHNPDGSLVSETVSVARIREAIANDRCDGESELARGISVAREKHLAIIDAITNAAPQDAVGDKPHSAPRARSREAATPDKPQGWPSATSQCGAEGPTAHRSPEPAEAASSSFDKSDTPIDMLLFCPRCGMQHVDSPEPENGWTNPPHATHTCKGCGLNWRPSNALTNGVGDLPAAEAKHLERMKASDPLLYTRSAVVSGDWVLNGARVVSVRRQGSLVGPVIGCTIRTEDGEIVNLERVVSATVSGEKP